MTGCGTGGRAAVLAVQHAALAPVVALRPSVLWSLDGEVFRATLRADRGGALHAADEQSLGRAAPAADDGRGHRSA